MAGPETGIPIEIRIPLGLEEAATYEEHEITLETPPPGASPSDVIGPEAGGARPGAPVALTARVANIGSPGRETTMDKTRISWTEATWNPMTGCTRLTPGCDNCYARKIAERFPAFSRGFEPWFHDERLSQPRHWKRPRRIFVNSMSDLFHRAFTSGEIDTIFAVMIRENRHTYQILTKRPERMAHYIAHWLTRNGLCEVPPHIWLGTSIELDRYCYRAEVLRSIPVPVRFISAEPLLGPLPSLDLRGISWLIVGGESGSGYRPMKHDWARDLLNKARAAGTAFYFKQSAARRPGTGRELDGRRYEEYPQTAQLAKNPV